MASHSRRRSRKKRRKLNKRVKLRILRYGTVGGALAVVFLLVLGITGGYKDPIPETVMENEYIPNEVVRNSLDSKADHIKSEEQKADEVASETDEDITLVDHQDESVESDALATVETEEDENPEAASDGPQVEEQMENENPESKDLAVSDDAVAKEDNVSGGTSNPVVGTEQNSGDISDAEIDKSPETSDQTSEEDTQHVKDEWVNNIINENIDSIAEDDLEAGTPIYNKLDTDYLLGLAEDGLTDEEREEAMAYLEEALTEDELAVMMILMDRYLGLVN